MPDYKPPFIAKSDIPLKSYFLYENRRWYREKTTEIYEDISPNYLDLWYDVPHYGKVNPAGQFVFPNPKKIIFPLGNPRNDKNVSGFDFALEALNEMIFFFKRGSASGKTGLGSLLNNFEVVNSFVNQQQISKQEASDTMSAYNRLINVYGLNSKVLNFHQYICTFIDLAQKENFKFTFFHRYTSIKSNLNSTGLSFEFLQTDHDDDNLKNKFYQHPEFHKYVKTTANFGFRINKNAPWMIAVDVNSKPMLQERTIKRSWQRSTKQKRIVKTAGFLQSKFITDPEIFFSKYYKNVMYESYNIFKEALISGYNDYQKNMSYAVDHGRPFIVSAKQNKLISDLRVVRPKSKQIDIKEYSTQEYNDIYFIDKFNQILKNEFIGQYNNKSYNNFKSNLNNSLKKEKDIDKSIDLIDRFYTLNKIYDPTTKKPAWTQPKKQLTPVKSYASLQDKPQPTVGKVVTEFMPDI